MNIITLMPFDSEKDLGRACNRSMSLLHDDQIGVIMDHDIMWTTLHWFNQIQDIFNLHSDLGILTVVTNRIGNFEQLPPGMGPDHPITRSHDITLHRKWGEELRNTYGTTLIDVTHSNNQISGLVIAVPKKVWNQVPFPEGGMFGIDNEYHRRVRDAGFRVAIGAGIYVYHWYRGEKLDLNEAKKR